jgi:outer membrane receptor for ferrienterochelin and colicins
MTHRTAPPWAVVMIICAVSRLAIAEGSSDELQAIYGNDQSISLATGYSRSLRDAPVSATIVSRDEIVQSGAMNLAELLQTVSAYYLSSNDAHSTSITVRGISSRVLVLVDGVPLYQGFVDATFSLQDVLLYNVERVEITRGPGSALYGADAMGGIINLITRTDSANTPRELGAVGGNLDTGGAWGLYHTNLGPAALRLYGAYVNGDYNDSTLKADAQTAFDKLYHTHDSLAPGPVNDAHQLVDTRAELSMGAWTGRVSFRDELHGGDGVGLAFALDPSGRIGSAVTTFELVHHSTPSPNWDLSGYLAYIDVKQDANATGYPPGAFGGAFPVGLRQILDTRETRGRGEFTATYAGWSRQKVLVSIGGFTNDFNEDADIRNYKVSGGRVLPTGSMAPFGGPGGTPIIGDSYDVVGYGVIQDEWTIVRDLTFTGGLRLDHYSTFGAQWTPRAALVFSPTPQATLKAIYSEAFRPPSAVELVSNGTFGALGNPALKPMQIHMGELDASYRLGRLEATLAAFVYRTYDLINTAPDVGVPTGLQYVNVGHDSGHGGEAGVTWKANDAWDAGLQYSYQRSSDLSVSGAQTQQAPRQLLDTTFTWKATSSWSAYVSSLAVADRGRRFGDPRPDPPNYLLFNLALRKRWGDRFSARARVSNLLNHQVNDPSESTTALPYDVPEPGRTWRIDLTANF